MSPRSWRVTVLVLAIAFAVAPAFSGGFGGFSPEQFPVSTAEWPAQPAGWAFSIWGVIYLALIVAAAWALFVAPDDAGWARACPPLAASLAVGVFWVEVASRAPVISMLMILAMLVGGVMALLRSGPQAWQRVPLGLYSGWLTAATAAGTSIILTGHGILGPQAAAVLMLIVAVLAAVAISAILPRPAWAYHLAVIWAFVGVIAANLAPLNLAVVAIAGIGIAAMAIEAARHLRGTGPA